MLTFRKASYVIVRLELAYPKKGGVSKLTLLDCMAHQLQYHKLSLYGREGSPTEKVQMLHSTSESKNTKYKIPWITVSR